MRDVAFHDLRPLPTDELASALKNAWRSSAPGLLSLSKRPHKRWTQELSFARPLNLSSSALYELILWVDLELDLDLPAPIAAEQQALLGDYPSLFVDSSDCGRKIEEYQARLRTHIKTQERDLFPDLIRRIPLLERAIRELGYEHRGLEKGFQSLAEAAATGAPLCDLSRPVRDRLDLDFYHLLEHHIERERDALYPACLFLGQGVDRA